MECGAVASTACPDWPTTVSAVAARCRRLPPGDIARILGGDFLRVQLVLRNSDPRLPDAQASLCFSPGGEIAVEVEGLMPPDLQVVGDPATVLGVFVGDIGIGDALLRGVLRSVSAAPDLFGFAALVAAGHRAYAAHPAVR